MVEDSYNDRRLATSKHLRDTYLLTLVPRVTARSWTVNNIRTSIFRSSAYARDGIADFVTPLALEDSCSLDAYGLGEAWPIKMAFQTVADLDFANLGATVAIVDRPAFIKLLQSLAFAAGGSVQT